MIQDIQELEAQLHALRPAAPGPDFAARLAAIAQRTPGTLTTAQAEVETSLRALTPVALPAALEDAILDQTVRRREKLVTFPAATPARDSRRWGRFALPIAAAVALLGAATALFVPTGQRASQSTGIAANGTEPRLAPPPAAIPSRSPALANGSPRFVPAGLNSSLHRANDEGVIWTSPNEAHRVLEVTYNDRVTIMDQHGRQYPVERPRVEYILIPEKID